MKKKPFLLLEVLIALLLVALIGIPLLTKPISMYRSELTSLEEMEGERLADWTFIEIKEMLLNHKIAWEKLPKYDEEKNFTLPPSSISLPGSSEKSIQRNFTLYCKREKEVKGTKQLTRLFIVKIFFDPPLSKKNTFYTYRLIVQRLPSATESYT